MADQQTKDKATLDSARLWLEQRRQKTSNSANFAPHTPPAQRSISTFSSPGSTLGKEEDVVIIELTQRYLYAGVEGDSGPQCLIQFGPQSNRRVGDYRTWLSGYKRKTESLESWGRDYELWRNDVGDVDTRFLSDVLERSVREAYSKHLLVDAGNGRLTLVLPSVVPHPVLETVLSTLFRRWKYSSITLLPSPTVAIVAAGLRSGLVVDIGWEETTVTCVYEYREVDTQRSTRAMKMLTHDFAATLKGRIDLLPERDTLRFDLDLIEDIFTKCAATIGSNVEEGSKVEGTDRDQNVPSSDPDVEFQWPGIRFHYPFKIPKHDLLKTMRSVLIGEVKDSHFDDNEAPLPRLIYESLLRASPDLRGICMSRIIFTGKAPVPTVLRHQILEGVELLIQKHDWDLVKVKYAKGYIPPLVKIVQTRPRPVDARHNIHIPTEKDYIEEKLLKQKSKSLQPTPQGTVREVHSLGPWAGASLLASLKVRGFVEIERDRFLSHGLNGASRDIEISVVPQQRVGSFASKITDRASWTMGSWA